MPNSRFPFQQGHPSRTHPSLLTEWHVSFITRPRQQRGGSAAGMAARPGLRGCGAVRGLRWPGRLCSRWVRSLVLVGCLTLLPSFPPPPPPPSGSCPPVLTLSLLVVLLLLFFFLSLAVGKNWLTRIIQAAPACWGLCKWIWELLVSHDSNVHYWRWMFLKKRLMMDIRLIVPFIILNII